MAESVEQRAYHGTLAPGDLAKALVVRFDSGETQAHWMAAEAGRAVVQIQSRRMEHRDPTTAVTVHISPTKIGITVSVSEQQVLSVAADMAKTGVEAWLNPLRLLGEIDDIARNARWLGLRAEVWKAVDEYCSPEPGQRGAAGVRASRHLFLIAARRTTSARRTARPVMHRWPRFSPSSVGAADSSMSQRPVYALTAARPCNAVP